MEAFFKSFWQVLGLLLFNKKATYFIYSFFRVDSVNGIYLDKFTDPLIDYSSIKKDYVIFDRGNNGIHRKPRLHKEKIIYTDAINNIAFVWAIAFVRIFEIKNRKTLNSLWQAIDKSFPEIRYNKRTYSRTIYYLSTLTNVYSFIMRRMGVRYLIAPARHAFLPLIPAAKENGIIVLELQHGITYGETITYSGFRDEYFTPDYFLSFGDMHPNDVYGIDTEHIVNIGWAFGKYFEKGNKEVGQARSNVLVISDPNITDKIIKVVLSLADANPDINFYFRPHPLEILSIDQMKLIANRKNVDLDDNKQNILSTLMRFKYVIGENSTVLYEAISMGKNVGKISMGGLKPIFLQEEDREMFWDISDNDTFKKFVSIPNNIQVHKTIYSNFDANTFEEVLS